MKYKYTLQEARTTGRPPEIEMIAYNSREDFEHASTGIVESRGHHGRIMQPVSDRAYLVIDGEGEFYFGGEEGQDEASVGVEKDDVLLIPRGTVYDYEQDSDVHYDLWE